MVMPTPSWAAAARGDAHDQDEADVGGGGMTPLDKNLKVTLGDDAATFEFLYTSSDEPYDSAHLYITVHENRPRKETISELTMADMVLLYQMLVEALGYDVEGGR